MEKKIEKKKTNIFLYTIIMSIVFVSITELVIWGYGSSVLLKAFLSAPQGSMVIGEAVLATLVLIVMLLFGNSYVLTQNKEKFTKGLFYGLFYFIGAVFFLLLNISMNTKIDNALSVINLFVGCFFIGVAEEFLCRGWLLNEFLERFGDTKKGIWYSIIFSGLVFGLLHLTNIFTMQQDVLATLVQVINAVGIGIMLGIIYYKTKNIWSVVALHGLWDFALMLSQIGNVTSTTEVVPNFSLISFIFAVVMILAELSNAIPYIKDIDAEPKKESVIAIAVLSFFVYFVFMGIVGLTGNSLGETYEYEKISLSNYSITRDNYDDYYINNIKYSERYSFMLMKNDSNDLVFINNNTKYSIEIPCQLLYDYIIMEDNDYYILAYVDYRDNSNAFMYYTYIYKDSLSNDNEFMDNIKNNMKKYLLSERSELLIINNRDSKSYLAAYNEDYGYYLLTSEDKMSILNNK